jgi:hypothetical protein
LYNWKCTEYILCLAFSWSRLSEWDASVFVQYLILYHIVFCCLNVPRLLTHSRYWVVACFRVSWIILFWLLFHVFGWMHFWVEFLGQMVNVFSALVDMTEQFPVFIPVYIPLGNMNAQFSTSCEHPVLLFYL